MLHFNSALALATNECLANPRPFHVFVTHARSTSLDRPFGHRSSSISTTLSTAHLAASCRAKLSSVSVCSTSRTARTLGRVTASVYSRKPKTFRIKVATTAVPLRFAGLLTRPLGRARRTHRTKQKQCAGEIGWVQTEPPPSSLSTASLLPCCTWKASVNSPGTYQLYRSSSCMVVLQHI